MIFRFIGITVKHTSCSGIASLGTKCPSCKWWLVALHASYKGCQNGMQMWSFGQIWQGYYMEHIYYLNVISLWTLSFLQYPSFLSESKDVWTYWPRVPIRSFILKRLLLKVWKLTKHWFLVNTSHCFILKLFHFKVQ